MIVEKFLNFMSHSESPNHDQQQRTRSMFSMSCWEDGTVSYFLLWMLYVEATVECI